MINGLSVNELMTDMNVLKIINFTTKIVADFYCVQNIQNIDLNFYLLNFIV